MALLDVRRAGMIANPSSISWKRRRWLSLSGVVLALVLASLAWSGFQRWSTVNAGMALMEDDRFVEAGDKFKAASDWRFWDEELAYYAAVAYRRGGKLEQFAALLHRAEEGGWPAEQIRLQRILGQTQHGLGTKETDAELDRICMQGADNFSALQIYEARAKGYMSLYHVEAAMQTLNFWIEWQPRAATPRLLRAQLYEQLQSVRSAELDCQAAVQAQPHNVEARIKYAQLLLLAQKPDQATEQFQACLKISPDEPRAQLGLIQMRVRDGGDLTDVEQSLQKIVDGHHPSEIREQALMLLTNVYLTRRAYAKVIEQLQEPDSMGRLSVPMCQALIRAHVALKHMDKAEKYRRLLEEKNNRRQEVQELYTQIRNRPSDPDLRYQMAGLCRDEGDIEAALTWWCTAIVAEPRHQPSHEALAKYYQSVGNLTRANAHRGLAENSVEHTFELAWQDYEKDLLRSVQKRLASIAPYKQYAPHADLLRCALDVKIKRHDFDPQRLEVLERLADYPHLRLKALTVLGSALVQVGDFSAAEPILLEVLKADPDMLEAHRALAALNFDLRALFRARHHFDEWGRVAPTDHRPLRFSGLVNNLLSFYKEAALAYEESLKRNPNQSTRQEVLLELAECQHRTRDYEPALKTLAQAVESVAGDALKAQCLMSLRRTDEARQTADSVLTRETTNLTANLVRADIAMLEKDDETALKCLLAATEHHPFEESAWYKLSQVYARQKKTAEATQASARVEKVRELRNKYLSAEEKATEEPNDVQLRYELMGLATQLGRDDLAQMWQRSIDLLQSHPPGETRAPGLDLGPIGPAELPTIEHEQPATQDQRPAELASP